ncbi:hypothetical protein BpHYR1_003727 [Brachionus plicatilis]|uniref:Uncharacterized protein n=1 Tax=Brachionus plicatilis TaxID=10195 RepID=A0A3M7QT15_BRAPC|nr:hypothetical protein BpHYR1_003727 [Brachionus plicatilis]
MPSGPAEVDFTLRNCSPTLVKLKTGTTGGKASRRIKRDIRSPYSGSGGRVVGGLRNLFACSHMPALLLTLAFADQLLDFEIHPLLVTLSLNDSQWLVKVLCVTNGLHESVDGAVRVCFNVSEKGIGVKLSYCSNCVAKLT